jgi:glucose-6-phosphate 1-dehydrogenase
MVCAMGEAEVSNRKPENNILVIFGASGDLARRKLVPALFTLFSKGLLPESFAVLGVGRTKMSDGEFRSRMVDALGKFCRKKPVDEATAAEFAKSLHYQAIDTAQAAEYAVVKKRLGELDGELQTGGNFIYYLATPPSLYQPIAEHLAAHGLNRPGGDGGRRGIIIEKPFGYDLDSARALNAALHRVFNDPGDDWRHPCKNLASDGLYCEL